MAAKILIVAALSILGTWAAFADTQPSVGYTFTTSQEELVIAYQPIDRGPIFGELAYSYGPTLGYRLTDQAPLVGLRFAADYRLGGSEGTTGLRGTADLVNIQGEKFKLVFGLEISFYFK